MVCAVATLRGCGGFDEQGVRRRPAPHRPLDELRRQRLADRGAQHGQRRGAHPPYDKTVKLDNYVAGAAGAGGADVQRQIEQMQQMIAKGYDAIIAFPISPTALNPTVRQACDRGIVVIAYDAELTEPCAYNVHINQRAAGQLTDEWLAKALKGKGRELALQHPQPASRAHPPADRARHLHRGDGQARGVGARRRVRVLFVCLPVPIDGATGSMVRPVALC
jgi:hypothetical protein